MKRDKLFKKYYKSKYHDYELSDTMSYTDDAGREPDIIFVYSGRNRGKSYEVCTQCLADAWYNDMKFAYVRRREATNFQIESYFADKIDFIQDMTDGECDGVHAKSGQIWLCKTVYDENGKMKREDVKAIGYFFKLSTQGSHKSEQFPDCYRLLYEEVLTDEFPGYVTGEPEKLLNLISTLERNKKNFKTYLVSNTVTIVNPYSKSWALQFGKTKPGEVRLTKLYLSTYDEKGQEKYYLIAGHYLKDKDSLTKEDLKKDRNRVKTSIGNNKWDEAKVFATADLSYIKQFERLDTVIFEYDDVLMQGDIIEVPTNYKDVIVYEVEPTTELIPVLYIRRKTGEPLPGTRVYTNNPDRINKYSTKGFKMVYKIDEYIAELTKRGWVLGADNLTMNDWDNIFKRLKLIS